MTVYRFKQIEDYTQCEEMTQDLKTIIEFFNKSKICIINIEHLDNIIFGRNSLLIFHEDCLNHLLEKYNTIEILEYIKSELIEETIIENRPQVVDTRISTNQIKDLLEDINNKCFILPEKAKHYECLTNMYSSKNKKFNHFKNIK